MGEKELVITPDEDGKLVLYLGITYKGKIYGGNIRFENELLEEGNILSLFTEQGKLLLSSSERTLGKLING